MKHRVKMKIRVKHTRPSQVQLSSERSEYRPVGNRGGGAIALQQGTNPPVLHLWSMKYEIHVRCTSKQHNLPASVISYWYKSPPRSASQHPKIRTWVKKRCMIQYFDPYIFRMNWRFIIDPCTPWIYHITLQTLYSFCYTWTPQNLTEEPRFTF